MNLLYVDTSALLAVMLGEPQTDPLRQTLFLFYLIAVFTNHYVACRTLVRPWRGRAVMVSARRYSWLPG